MTFKKVFLNELRSRHGQSSTLANNILERAIGDAPAPILATRTTSAPLARRTVATSHGLSPLAVIVVVGSLTVLFLVFVFIGIICKYANKPRSATHIGSYAINADNKMYQPSSAAPESSKPAAMYGSKANLLSGAASIAGRGDDPMRLDSPDTSFDGPSFGNAGSMPGQHHRTTSSSVGLPGPAAAARRGGPSNTAGPSHPPLGGSQRAYPPDGSGFTPGQVVGQGGPRLPSTSPQPGGRSPYGQYSGGPSIGVARSNSRVQRGPPPARANSRRQSRYSGKPARVVSIGPGVDRQSRYFDENDFNLEDMGAPTNFSRRNSKRMSRAGGGGSRVSRYGLPNSGSSSGLTKSPSIYGAKKLEGEILKKAQQEGWGAGSNENLRGIIANGAGARPNGGSPSNQYRPAPSSSRDPLGAGPSQYGRVGTSVQPQQQVRPYQRPPPPQQGGGSGGLGFSPGGTRAPAGTYAPGPYAVRPVGGGYSARPQPQAAGGAGARQLL